MLIIEENMECIPSNKILMLKRTHTAKVMLMTNEVLKRDFTISEVAGKEYWTDVQTGTLYDKETLKAINRNLPYLVDKPTSKQDSKKCNEVGRRYDLDSN